MTYFMSTAYTSDSNPAIGVTKHAEAHYAITSKFVTKYWTGKLNPDSLVFINACSSASLDAVEFETACLRAGASHFVGWSDRMRLGEALDSAGFLFDRMIGANSTELGKPFIEQPEQRAFGIIEVLGEMATRQRPTVALPLDTSVAPPLKMGDPTVQAKLQNLTSLNGKLELLAPSIHDLSVREQTNELFINGDF